MGSRSAKPSKRAEVFNGHYTSVDQFIERLKKIRALNGDPSLVGMEGYVLKRLQFNKLNILTRA